MNEPLLGHLPASRFIGRKVKAYIDGQGHCVVFLKEIKKNRVVVETPVARTRHQVSWANIQPYWGDNQDLLKESVLASKSLNEGGVPVFKAFEEASKPLHPPVNPQPAKPEPVAQSGSPPESMKPQPSIPALPVSRKVKRLIVDIDSEIDWRDDLRLLQETLEDGKNIEHQIADLRHKLIEQQGLVDLCISTLENKGIGIVWDSETSMKERLPATERKGIDLAPFYDLPQPLPTPDPTLPPAVPTKPGTGPKKNRRTKAEVQRIEKILREQLASVKVGEAFVLMDFFHHAGLEKNSHTGRRIFGRLLAESKIKFQVTDQGIHGNLYKRIS